MAPTLCLSGMSWNYTAAAVITDLRRHALAGFWMAKRPACESQHVLDESCLVAAAYARGDSHWLCKIQTRSVG